MGVHGLWRLIEPSGKPVPLETLENKILAVDISIWLHQAVKGFQDARGAQLPNAHLLGIYHRLCKLLYFRIKPVFVFDGGVPVLKKQTIAKRNQQKTKNLNDATNIQQKLISTLLKHSAIQKAIEINDDSQPKNVPFIIPSKTKDDLFNLPEQISSSELDTTYNSDESETETESSPTKQWGDLHTIDEKGKDFTSLPADVRHEILTELKEQRKQSSWGRLHELPKQSGDFAQFQMKRLLKRYSVQVSLEEAEKEMGGHTLSLNELEKLLTDEGIVTVSKNEGKRIASNENKRFLYIKDVQKAIEDAKNKDNTINEEDGNISSTKDSEYERDLEAAIKLSLQDPVTSQNIPSTSKNIPSTSIDIPSTSKDTPSTSRDIRSISDDEPSTSKHVKSTSEDIPSTSSLNESSDDNKDSEYQRDLEAAIKLSLQETESHDNYLNSISEFMYDSDSESDREVVPKSTKLNAAERYMMEYADLTPYEISKLTNRDKSIKNKKTKDIIVEAVIERPIENKSSHLDVVIDLDAINDKNDNENPIENIDSNKSVEILDSNRKILVDSDRPKILENKSVLLNRNDNNSSPVENIKSENVPDISILSEVTTSNTKTEIKTENKVQSDNSEAICVINDSNKSTNKTESKTNVITSSTDLCVSKIKTNLIETVIDSSTEVMSDSDDSDFVEVTDSVNSNKKTFEVVINPNISTTDDLFDDIFNQPEVKKDDELDKIDIVEPDDVNVTKTVEKKRNVISPIKSNLTLDELNKMKSDLVQEKNELISERNLRERLATDITNQMYLEAQELLELFGVPYVIAPMEAESQCAFLNLINLTDGTITDDSDIWLFGGETVYKNFFNQKKHVLEYRAERIKQYFKLTREQMILLALLVGSDYTIGIQGIGPVTALEILSLFPPAKNIDVNFLSQTELLSGLMEFKNWLKGKNLPGPGRTTLRSKLQNINLTETFPSFQVVQAYLEPEVETCRDKFSWGKPDIVGLIDYAKEKFGWTRLKSEEILKPVMKKLEDRNIQKSIRDYFATKHKLDFGVDNAESKMSKRVKTAVNKIGKSKEELKAEQENTIKEKGRKKQKKTDKSNTKKGSGKNKSGDNVINENPIRKREEIFDSDDEIESDFIKSNIKKKPVSGSRNKKNKSENDKDESNSNDKDENNKNDKDKNTRNRKNKNIVNTKDNNKNTEIKNTKSNIDETGLSKISITENIDSNIEGTETNPIDAENKMILDLIESEYSGINVNIVSQKVILEKESKEVEKPQRRRRRDYVEPEPKPKAPKVVPVEIHKKETIPQKEKDKVYAIKSKLKAIEIYRKAKLSPKSNRRKKSARLPKENAGLSESSDSN